MAGELIEQLVQETPQAPDLDRMLRRGAIAAVTPLAGQDYSDSELYDDPSKIMSPERILGMVSSPVDLIGNFMTGGGLGAGVKSALGLAGVIPPNVVRKVAATTARKIANPQVREAYEWISQHAAPTAAAHVTDVKIGPVPHAYAGINSRFEELIDSLGSKYFKQVRAKDPLSMMTQKQANDHVREQLLKNLSPKRVDSLSKVGVIRIDPTAHSNFIELMDSMGHEVVGHGRQIRTMGRDLQKQYADLERQISEAGGRIPQMRPDPNKLEEGALRIGDRIANMYRKWHRETYKNRK